VPSCPRDFRQLVAEVRHWGMLTGTDSAQISLRGALGLPRKVERTANTGIVLLHWVKGAQCLQFSNSNRAGDRRKSNLSSRRAAPRRGPCGGGGKGLGGAAPPTPAPASAHSVDRSKREAPLPRALQRADERRRRLVRVGDHVAHGAAGGHVGGGRNVGVEGNQAHERPVHAAGEAGHEGAAGAAAAEAAKVASASAVDAAIGGDAAVAAIALLSPSHTKDLTSTAVARIFSLGTFAIFCFHVRCA